MAMTLRLTDEEARHLAESSEADRSGDETLRGALAEDGDRQSRDEQLNEVLGRVLPRYRGLLDKLGSV